MQKHGRLARRVSYQFPIDFVPVAGIQQTASEWFDFRVETTCGFSNFLPGDAMVEDRHGWIRQNQKNRRQRHPFIDRRLPQPPAILATPYRTTSALIRRFASPSRVFVTAMLLHGAVRVLPQPAAAQSTSRHVMLRR
jgi:hypothetical protein